MDTISYYFCELVTDVLPSWTNDDPEPRRSSHSPICQLTLLEDSNWSRAAFDHFQNDRFQEVRVASTGGSEAYGVVLPMPMDRFTRITTATFEFSVSSFSSDRRTIFPTVESVFRNVILAYRPKRFVFVNFSRVISHDFFNSALEKIVAHGLTVEVLDVLSGNDWIDRHVLNCVSVAADRNSLRRVTISPHQSDFPAELGNRLISQKQIVEFNIPSAQIRPEVVRSLVEAWKRSPERKMTMHFQSRNVEETLRGAGFEDDRLGQRSAAEQSFELCDKSTERRRLVVILKGEHVVLRSEC